MDPSKNKAVNESPQGANEAFPTDPERRKSAIDAIVNPNKGATIELENVPKFTSAEELPSKEELIDALGIPNWRDLEKKIVRRLDMTLMPTLWVSLVILSCNLKDSSLTCNLC